MFNAIYNSLVGTKKHGHRYDNIAHVYLNDSIKHCQNNNKYRDKKNHLLLPLRGIETINLENDFRKDLHSCKIKEKTNKPNSI